MSEQEMRRIGDYEILAELGSGGMGQVFKVRNVISDRIEAMKIILPDLAGRQDLADRFLREIKLLAGLDHPNIAALRTALTVNNQLVMIMEYVEGKTLAACVESGPIALPDAVNYIDQVLSALSYAHQRNIIHRDIKPSNMMLTPAGVVKLMDFGIARSDNDTALTATGTALGSLYYMSPEQVKGQPTDARSDLYSVGASLYELVTGQHPFNADSSYSLMAAQVQQAPKPPIEIREGLPSALNEIILLAMAKEPGQRFQSADALRNALKNSGVAAMQSATAPSAAASSAGQTAQAAAMAATLTSLPAQPVAKTTGAAPVNPTPTPVPIVQPAPSVIEMSQQNRSHRGLYMALGGLVVVAFLVAAGIYIPRRDKARAEEQTIRTEQPVSSSSAPAADANGQPASVATPVTPTPPSAPANGDSATTSPNPPAGGTLGSSGPGGGDAGASAMPGVMSNLQSSDAGAKRASAKSSNATRHAVQETMGGEPAAGSAPPDNSAALDELEQQIDHLSGREAAVNESLENLKRQQAAQGYGLRGDITAAQERAKINIGRAQQALQGQDLTHAKKYADQAAADLELLERFLGR